MLWWTLRKLRTGDGGARAEAVRALQDSNDPRAREAIVAALRDPDSRVRIAAAMTLNTIADPSTFDALLAALSDDAPNARAFAAAGLGRIGDPRALKPLIDLAVDASYPVRMAVAQALGKLGGGDATILTLTALMFDEKEAVAEQAALSLLDVDPHWVDRPEAAVVVPKLVKALERGSSPNMKIALASMLGRIGDRAARPALLKLTVDQDGNVRATAQEAIQKLRP